VIATEKLQEMRGLKMLSQSP